MDPCSCRTAGQCRAEPGHPVPRASSIQSRGKGLPAGQAARGSFQRKFNEISVLLLTGKQVCDFKAGHYHGVFFLYFNLKFCFKQGESNILSFSVGHTVKSKSERPKKCTACEAEDPAYIHKRSRSIFCSSKTKLSFRAVDSLLGNVAKQHTAVTRTSPLK